MGLFDFFTKETEINDNDKDKKGKKNNRPVGFSAKKGSDASSDGGTVKVFVPASFDDVCKIIDFLLLNKPAVVKLTDIKDDTIQRVMDILSGACYALHGSISEIYENIYLISPEE